MSTHEAILVAAAILGKIGALAVVGLVGLAAIAWAWYKYDGGKMGFFAWLRGI